MARYSKSLAGEKLERSIKMKWVYDLTGAEPIIMDQPIFDATTIAQGELLQVGASTLYSAGDDAGVAYVTACPSSVGATQGLNAIGICLETKTTADSPSIAAAHNLTTGAHAAYGKVSVNPFAVYRALVTTSSAGTIRTLPDASPKRSGDR